MSRYDAADRTMRVIRKALLGGECPLCGRPSRRITCGGEACVNAWLAGRSSRFSDLYDQYLWSSHWRDFRRKILSERGKCENCASMADLEVHHLYYDSIGMESAADVRVLCRSCHESAHADGMSMREVRRRIIERNLLTTPQ